MGKAEEVALKSAKLSKCKKRKVGACITDSSGKIVSTGFNHNFADTCEDEEGNTLPSVIHAEVMAIQTLPEGIQGHTIYVTHQPCGNCAKAIKKVGIKKIVIVDNFMKFDSGKLRYGLIPPEALKALAEVLTYGAKKYKPNNWQGVDDINRYVDALYRHLEAWRSGEKTDSESNLSHLSHALTNIAFLIYFENNNIK